MTVNIELLERILNGIWSGELPHDQTNWFCGSKKCVAGWVLAFTCPETLRQLMDLSPTMEQSVFPNKVAALELQGFDDCLVRVNCSFIEGLAAFKLGINEAEAKLLFSCSSNRFLHEKVLTNLKRGKRLSNDVTILEIINHAEVYDFYEAITVRTNKKSQVERFLVKHPNLEVYSNTIDEDML